MRKILSIQIILLCFIFMANAQYTIKGHVMDSKQDPLIGATIQQINSSNGTVTATDGSFTLKLSLPTQLIISYVGYRADTLTISSTTPLHIILKEDATKLDDIVISASTTFIDKLEPRHFEVITEKELQKAACCNLSESFETNASVDVSITDAVSGAKMIRMLGLDGRYVQINRENIPQIRGLIGRFGLGFIPGTWIQSIDVGKGSGSVVNGFESMAGQINLEFKKTDAPEKWYFNAYANSFGRLEANVNYAGQLNDNWSTSILTHWDYFGNSMDTNNDDFLDMPLSRQINVLQRFKYEKDRIVSQIGYHVMRDEKAGGQVGFGFGDNLSTSQEYGFVNNTTHAEVFGKTGILYPHKPYRGLGFIYSASYTNINGGFGRNLYAGTEKTLYGNVIFQGIHGSSFHQFRTGTSVLIDDFDEIYADSAFARREFVPGMYYEYTFHPEGKFTFVAGMRMDYHNLYGWYWTPRLHTKWEIAEQLSFRGSIGRGYRTPNIIIENTQSLISSRRLVIAENPLPEVSWNAGGSLVSELKVGSKKVGLVADYFYTWFENQSIFDMDQNSGQLKVYNLDGESFAHSFQLEASTEIIEELHIKAAYKYYDVKTTLMGQLRQMPMISRDRFFVNASYATKYEKWKADATLQWFGNQRLPDTNDKPVEFQRPTQTPDFFLLNAQVSRGFRWGNVYLGSENLLNFTQKNPIIDPQNPFGNQFDASLVWAPIVGRMIYTGFRLKIK